MRVVIIGGGIAADYIANKLLEQEPTVEVLILSKEAYAPYDRIHLCELVDESATVEDIRLELDSRVTLKLNHEVTAIDRKGKQVICEDKRYDYDYLIIASGSRPRTLFDISELDNAVTFRSADDSYAIRDNLENRNVVIVGAGPIGLELLETLERMPQPKAIYMINIDGSLYAPDIDPTGVEMIRATYEADPRVHISLWDSITETETENGLIKTLKTKKLEIDDPIVVMGVGITPNIDFARNSLECDRGVLVDDHMNTEDLFIYAVGEAAQMRSTGFSAGHAKDCREQADTAIGNILKTEIQNFKRDVAIDGLKVGSFVLTDVVSPFYDMRDEANEVVLFRSGKEGRMDQFIINNEKLVRFIGINSNVDPFYLKQLIDEQRDVDADYLYHSREPNERGPLICSCTGAYQNDLVELIQENAITSLLEMKACSEAGTVCGRCKKEIAHLIETTEVNPEEIERRKREKVAAEEAAKRQVIEKRLQKFNAMHPANQIDTQNLEAALDSFDKRKEMNGWISMMTLNLELPASFEGLVNRSVQQLNKVPVVWLELADCSGNSEAFIKTVNPTIDELILNFISLDYHELLMVASGPQSENRLDEVIEQDFGGYVLMVEGAIPMAMEGKYLRIGPNGETGLELLRRVAKGALAVFSIGSCAYDGGVVAAAPNPTGAVGVAEALERDDIVNLPGCPVNPINVVGTLLHYVMLGELPELDAKNRPLWAYGPRIHDNCERRGHYEAGEFVKEWGDEGAKKGWCLFEMGCKGPYADANCSLAKFNEGTSWPVQVGHGCFGCVEGKIAFDQYANNRPLATTISADQIK